MLNPKPYIALEETLTRRLIAAWRVQADPIYEAIAKACRVGNYDGARKLVQELDLKPIGVENREWIKYMLLSCAIAGANTVSKTDPSFVGVGSFDTLLNKVVSTIQQYLEHNATAQVRQQAVQLIAQDEKAASKIQKSNPYHDAEGKFTDKESSVTSSEIRAFLDKHAKLLPDPDEDAKYNSPDASEMEVAANELEKKWGS